MLKKHLTWMLVEYITKLSLYYCSKYHHLSLSLWTAVCFVAYCTLFLVSKSPVVLQRPVFSRAICEREALFPPARLSASFLSQSGTHFPALSRLANGRRDACGWSRCREMKTCQKHPAATFILLERCRFVWLCKDNVKSSDPRVYM